MARGVDAAAVRFWREGYARLGEGPSEKARRFAPAGLSRFSE
jgi:hypothetical protein